MATQTTGPRKRRTRQHVIADLSVHHVERFILEQGHTAQRLSSDNGYDLLVSTFDEVAMAGDMAGVAPLVLGRVIEVQFVTDRVPNLDIGSTIAWGGATYTVRDLRRIDEGGATVVRCERA